MIDSSVSRLVDPSFRLIGVYACQYQGVVKKHVFIWQRCCEGYWVIRANAHLNFTFDRVVLDGGAKAPKRMVAKVPKIAN